MRIAVLVREFPNVSETFVLGQVTGLIDRGCDVTVLAENAPDGTVVQPAVARYGLAGKAVYYVSLKDALRHPATALRSLRFGAQAGRVMRAYGAASRLPPFDVIHCHFGPLGLLGARLRALGGLAGRVVTTFHGFDITAHVAARGEHVYDELFRRGDLFLPISDLWRARLVELGCPPDRIEVHRMGIDLRRFRFREREAGVPLELVSIARLTPKKGIEYGIRAVAAARTPVRYRIAGEGPLRSELEALIVELGVADRVELLGAVDQDAAAALLESAHVLLAPSITAPGGDMEGIPVALMEAMATGLPVVTTRHSGIPELVTHEETGYLAPERDVDALAAGIGRVCDNPTAWTEAARRVVHERHDIEKLNDRLVERFARLTGRQTATSSP